MAVASLTLGIAACERPYLTWTPREPLAARRGRLAITVEDRRPGDHRLLGRVVGWGGAPRELLVGADHVRDRIEQLGKTAAITAGLGLAAPAETPSARLALAVSTLRCDGTGLAARAELEVTMAIQGADGAQAIAPQTVAARGKAGSCEGALEKTLDELLDELGARLVQGPLHDLALGEKKQETGDRRFEIRDSNLSDMGASDAAPSDLSPKDSNF